MKRQRPTKHSPRKKEALPALRHRAGFRGPSLDVGKATQFKPGQSGNPGGSVKKFDRIISEAMRAQLAEKVTENRSYASRIGENVVKVLNQQLAQCAETGRFRKELVPLIEFMTDRLEGKPVQPVLDVSKNIENRSTADLSYWLLHKHFPEDTCECSEEIKNSKLPPVVGTT
jgi:uncharacterized protein DUF5681